jgi:hypothetical protein
MTKLKSVGYYTQGLNTGVEFAVREDGAVFSRNKAWNDHFRNFATSKWQRDEYWEIAETFKDLPPRVCVGFGLNGDHVFVTSARLRLPQEDILEANALMV